MGKTRRKTKTFRDAEFYDFEYYPSDRLVSRKRKKRRRHEDLVPDLYEPENLIDSSEIAGKRK